VEQEYQEMIKTIDLELKKDDLSQSRRTELEAQRKDTSRQYVRDIAPSEANAMRSQFEQILNGSGTEAEKVQAVEDLYISWQSSVAATVGSLDSNEASALLKPFEALRDTYKKRAAGEYSDEETKRRASRIMEAQKLLLLSDPKLARIAAGQDLFDFGSFDTYIQQDVFNNVMGYVVGNSGEEDTETKSPFSSQFSTKKGLESYFNMTVDAILNGDDSRKKSGLQHLNNLLGSFSSFESLIQSDPTAGIKIVELISSQKFLKAIRENPDAITNLDGARQVIEMNYNDEVWGMVEEEFRRANVRVPTSSTSVRARGVSIEDTSSLVQAVPSAAGMSFKPVEGLTDLQLTEAKKEAKRLNSELAPIINSSVKALSHLEGHSDYKKTWETISEEVLSGGTGQEEAAGGDEGDDLTLDDFKFPTIETTSLPSDVAEDKEFLDGVSSLAEKYEIDPSVLMSVMHFETGGTFSPSQKNAAGSSGTGLIQFMAKTAKELGTSTSELAKLSRADQLVWVERYLDQYVDKIKGGNASDVYMAVLFPKAIDKSDDYVLFRSGTKAYSQNIGLDENGDGIITKAEAAKKVVSLVGKYEA
jgi:hypothetical protein